ncbi:unnamed protein product, partial [Rotaria sp. Silwood2]
MVLSDNSSANVIKRKAINAFGCLGSLYDGCRDYLLVQDNRNVQRQSFKSSGSAKCIVIQGNSDAGRNILRTIDIENDLRLSLLLNLTPKIGIAAILNNSYRINEYTRFLYYSWIDREEQVSNEGIRNLKLIDSIKSTTPATHIITGVNYGIDVLVVLQLPSETGLIPGIDHILQKISRSLSNDNEIVSLLTTEESDQIRKITNVTVYSNISDLTALNNIFQLLHKLQIIKKSKSYPPITYYLQPLAVVYSQHMRNNVKFHILPSELNNNLEQYVLDRRTMIINFTRSFPKNLQNFLSGYLEGKLCNAYKECLHMRKKYLLEIEQLSKLLIGVRNGQMEISVINNALINKEQVTLKNEHNELVHNLNDLEAKANLINDLLNQNFQYCNVVERDVNKYDNEHTIKTKLIEIDHRDRVLCSDDTLNQRNREQFNKLLFYLMQEKKQNPNLRLIYADFSYSSYKLYNMYILSSNNNKDLSIQKSYPSFKNLQTSVSLPRREPLIQQSVKEDYKPRTLPATDEIINILLLGETSVGKSTFINALANYLAFDSLEQVQLNQPIVLIPVSFIMTTGDNFDERIVKFGDMVNYSNDEDFNHPGQSVTQHCKSYIFDLKHTDEKFRRKIRIIDTPGFGDTRGLDQDNRNMEHILQYINNLTHLNAICFLLKPNETRLNIFFRTCLIQLFSLLGPTARNNIIFCFTNARSTFYTPGNTAPLLKTMLASSSMSDIAFKKENTFCFDNESFRYLVALRNRISFTHEEKHEYEMSWSTSVKESNSLIDYIG